MPKLPITNSIGRTLFLAMTLVVLLTVVGIALFITLSLQQGFKDHMRGSELSHLTMIDKTLAYLYRKHGGWQFLAELEKTGDMTARIGEYARSVPELTQLRNNRQETSVHDWEVLPNPNRPAPQAAGQWQVLDDNTTETESVTTPLRPIQEEPPNRPMNDMLSLGQRFAILDAEGNYLAGNKQAEPEPRRAIYIQQDGQEKLIGYLVLAKPIYHGNIENGLSSDDQVFINQQINRILAISIFAILMSAIAAFAVARYFRHAIQAVADGVRQVAAGDFSVRLSVNRQDELGAVARDFNQMAEQLSAYERSRRQWVADTSHELRTPITILSTHLEAMTDGIIPTSPERLGVLVHTVADMNRLVGDLHQLASADAGIHDYQFQAIDVGDLLVDLEQAFTTKLAQLKLSLHVENQAPMGLRIEADRLRLTQVLANLLTNSGRYTDAGGQVHIKAQLYASQLKLIVEDTSPSVSADALPYLFDRFYRADASRSRKNGGSGLGLAICQAIVKAHDGMISASHSLLGGLRVEILLPLEKGASA